MIGSPAHSNRQLNLPRLSARGDENIHQLAQLWNNQRGDLRIDTGSDSVLLHRVKRFESRIKRTFHASQVIVEFTQTINGDAQCLKTCIDRRLYSIFSQVKSARLHRTVHPLLPDFPNDLEPITPEVGFSAYQRNLACSHSRQLANEVETFTGS